MQTNIYELSIAGHSARYLLYQPGSEAYFNAYNYKPLRCCDSEEYDIVLTEQDMLRGRELAGPYVSDAELEYKMLLWPTASHLLRRMANIVHAVAICWCGKAWLLCAPSGTGKTTQFIRWRQCAGAEARLLSGDMTAVSIEPNDRVAVWASPWTGKEHWVGDPGPVDLGGIIFLEQAEHNELVRLSSSDAVSRLINSVVGRPEADGDVPNLSALINKMLEYPVWLLRNRGDTASARLVMEAIQEERSKEA